MKVSSIISLNIRPIIVESDSLDVVTLLSSNSKGLSEVSFFIHEAKSYAQVLGDISFVHVR